MTKKNRSRPLHKDVLLKNGYYIEVSNPGFKRGVKIWRANKEDMQSVLAFYSIDKTVVVLGEYRDGIPVSPNKNEA